MKPIITWVILANAELARVVENRGPGKGLAALDGKTWHADPPVEYSDKPGQTQSSGGPGRAAMSQADIKDLAAAAFARAIGDKLKAALGKAEFDRLILAAAPHMLGHLRHLLPKELQDRVVAEVAKDLTHLPIRKLPEHFGHVIAV